MTLLCEEAVVLDGAAEPRYLSREIIGLVVDQLEGFSDRSDFLVLVVELDGSRVAVLVVNFPAPHPVPQSLEWP